LHPNEYNPAVVQELMRAGLAAHQRAASAESPVIVHVGATFRPKPALPPLSPSAAERVAHFKADPVTKPQTQAARSYLEQRFGVPAPVPGPIGDRPAGGAAPVAAGSMSKGLTPAAAPGPVLPKGMRDNPYASTPQQVTDLELEKVRGGKS
jgi:hypothetical protein